VNITIYGQKGTVDMIKLSIMTLNAIIKRMAEGDVTQREERSNVDMEAEMYEIIKSKEFWQPPATEKGKE
jgi:hypothetical protein